ncbi:MAG: hypothetical protein IJT41_09685 [Clostridia bacterium]|nr:hypothetical protein [Clostridia bacterium]
MYILFDYLIIPSYHVPTVAVNCIVLNALFLSWGLGVLRRFPQKQMRLHLLVFVVSCVLLMLLRTAKYAFVSWDGTLQRHLWYAYYTPFVFGPAALFNASTFLGKPDDAKAPKSRSAVYLISSLISAGILTNDLHALAFRFAPGFAGWQTDYTHGPLYYTAAAWMLFCGVCMIVNAMRTAFSRRLVRTVWLPILVLTATFVGGFFIFFFGRQMPSFLSKMELPEYVCLCGIAFWESMAAARIISGNKDYPELFAASSLRAGIADSNLRVQRVSENGVRPEPQQLRRALGGTIELPDGSTLLKARPVRGGFFYWTENIASMRQLNRELNETADYLNEENAAMRLAAEIDETRIRTAQQNRVYDRVTQALLPQLDAISAWTDDLPQDEADFRVRLQKIGVLLAYCKRYGNLLLQADEKALLSGAELLPCFEESAKALKNTGVPCTVAVDPSVTIPVQEAAALYRWVETVVEQTLPALGYVGVSLDGAPCLHLQAQLSGKPEPETLDALSRALRETQSETAGTSVRFTLRGSNGEEIVCV